MVLCGEQVGAADLAARATRLCEEPERGRFVGLHATAFGVEQAQVGAAEGGAPAARLAIGSLRIPEVHGHAEPVLVKRALVAAAFCEPAAAGPLECGHGPLVVLRHAAARFVREAD